MKYSVKIPVGIQGSKWGRLVRHIQGVWFTSGGIVFSRNGDKRGELIIPSRDRARIPLRRAHAGGIDAFANHIVVPTYNHEEETGALTIYKPGWARYYRRPLKYRPYAAAIEQTKGGFLVAIVANPLGTQIEWYRVPKALNGLEYLGETKPVKWTEPRNNICLHWHKGEMLLFTMRAHTAIEGCVVKYRVERYRNGIGMFPTGIYENRNALFRLGPSARFGATIRKAGHSDDVVLVRTARNIWKNRIEVSETAITPNDWKEIKP